MGDGACFAGYNSSECGWDGGDCIDVKTQFNYDFPYCKASHPEKIGDGRCDGHELNNMECGWDNGGETFIFVFRISMGSLKAKTKYFVGEDCVSCIQLT